jgi:hypothetical protein
MSSTYRASLPWPDKDALITAASAHAKIAGSMAEQCVRDPMTRLRSDYQQSHENLNAILPSSSRLRGEFSDLGGVWFSFAACRLLRSAYPAAIDRFF